MRHNTVEDEKMTGHQMHAYAVAWPTVFENMRSATY
ncbi:MAG: hypothetical protein K0S45_4419 [Nitrospira sp.]|nr:hypothetical protein [Nitrospira sp.]